MSYHVAAFALRANIRPLTNRQTCKCHAVQSRSIEIWARILLSPKSRQTTTSIDIYQTRKVVHAEFKNEREVFWKPVFSAKRNYSSEWKQDKRDLINHLNNLPPLINLVFAVSIPLLRRNKCNKISRVTKWQPQAPSIQLMSLPFQSLLFCRRLSTVASLAS